MNEPNVKCLNCGKNFYKKPNQILVKPNHFCSVECFKVYTKPVFGSCLNCGKPLTVRRNEFCNHSCAAKFNNQGRCIRLKTVIKKLPKCPRCKVNSTPTSKTVCYDCTLTKRVGSKTKGELYQECKDYQSARSTISKNSRNVFDRMNKPKVCYVCLYSAHVEVCHIKSVSSFTDNDLISDINSPSNLVYLCPNHHWEYDNGLISLMPGGQIVKSQLS